MEIKPLSIKLDDANNIDIWLVEDHRLPIINIEFAYLGGSSFDKDKHGLSYLMTALLDEGAGDLNDVAFHKALDDTATHLHFSATRDLINGSIKMLRKNRDRSVELLNMALFKPNFEQDAMERVKAQINASIKSAVNKPSEQAAKKLMKLCFGDHVYGNLVKGSEESLELIRSHDLKVNADKSFHQMTPYMVIVGDLNEAEAKDLVQQIFADQKISKESIATIKDAEFVGRGKSMHHKMDVPQSVVNFALPSIGQDDPDFIALLVLNHIFGGGGFSSRLMEEIREKRGLTYGIHTSLLPLKHGAIITGSAATSNDKMSETVKILREEIVKMHDHGITEKELLDAKTYLTGAYPLRFDTGSKIAHELLSMQYFDFGIDFIHDRNKRVEQVSVEQIGALAKKLLKEDQMAQVIAGQQA